ncbi:MAG: HEAT repeat domain-containing protein, partial [Myxococcota bacterium]
QRLAYGTYVGLLRQAPATGESDVTHKVRRDSIARLSALASTEIGQDVVLPVLRQSLNDPNHLVRRAAIAALTEMYPDEKDSLIPLLLMLKSSAADVGKAAVDGLIGKALDGNEHARRHAQRAVDAPVADVRKHALGMLPRLFETGSAEPFVLALGSGYADLRLLVVDRLVDSTDDRVKDALTRALSSTDEDLRLKAAAALARRGDDSTVDVLAGLLRSERGAVASHATEALVALAHARPDAEELTAVRAKAAEAIAQRLTDDPDQTADKGRLIDALGRIRSAAGAPALLAFADGEEAGWRKKSVDALMNIALDRATPPLQLRDGTRRARYQERLLLEWLVTLSESKFEELRVRTARILRDVDDRAAESILAALLLDRSEAVRTAACEALAFRAEVVEGASLDALAQTLRGGQRELVLPAATGLAARQRPEAFQALLLVFKAGTQDERLRAVLALGNLGDVRALEEFRPFVDPTAVLEPEDQALSPTVGRAYGRMLRHLPADATERSEVRETLDRLATETIGAIRLTALTGLREAGDEHSRALLERTAGDPAEQVPLRRHALQELAIFGHPGSEPLLVELLTDRNVSNDALAALERLFPADRTRTRLHMLKSANTTYQQRAAAYLTQHGRAETLVEALGQIDDALVRATLRRGLLRRGSGTPPSKGAEGTFGKDALRTLLTSEKPGPREDAAILAAVEPEVGRSLSNELGAAISKALAGLKARRDVDEDRALRAGLRAATALELAQLAPAREALNLDRASPDLRRAAIEHLAALGDASDRDRVQNGVLDLDPVVRQIAGAALAKREAGSDLLRAPVVDAVALRPVVAAEKARDESSLYSSPRTRQITLPVVFADRDAPGLVEAAEDKGSDRRLPAIDALGRLASEAAEQTLQAIFTDEQEEANIRKAAFRSLRRHQRRRARLERGHAS